MTTDRLEWHSEAIADGFRLQEGADHHRLVEKWLYEDLSKRPHLANSRITVADVVLMHLRLGQSLEELAGKLDLSLASLHAAMAYYNDHQTDIDRSLHEDAAFEQAFRHDNPSPLGEKLSVLRHRG